MAFGSEKDDKQDKDSGGSKSIGSVVLVLCLLLAAAVGIWQFVSRQWMGPAFGVDVKFTAAADTLAPGVASRFMVHVAHDKTDKPLPGRVIDVKVTPPGKARILSVSGSSAQGEAMGTRALGRTDAQGNLEITVAASEPGEYTLVATDTVPSQEGTSINFHVAAPGG